MAFESPFLDRLPTRHSFTVGIQSHLGQPGLSTTVTADDAAHALQRFKSLLENEYGWAIKFDAHISVTHNEWCVNEGCPSPK